MLPKMTCNSTKNVMKCFQKFFEIPQNMVCSVIKFTNANHKSEQFEYAVTFNAFSSIAYHLIHSSLYISFSSI